MRVCDFGTFLLVVVLFLPQLGAEPPVSTFTAVPSLTVPSSPVATTDGGEASHTNDSSNSSIDWMTSYNEARAEGTQSDRPIMLFVTMKDCRYCTKMQQNSFDNIEVKNEIVDSFVPAKLYLDPESYLGKSLKITLFPTTMFIAPDGAILGYVRGYVSRENFRAELLAAKSANAERVRVARLESEAINE